MGLLDFPKNDHLLHETASTPFIVVVLDMQHVHEYDRCIELKRQQTNQKRKIEQQQQIMQRQ